MKHEGKASSILYMCLLSLFCTTTVLGDFGERVNRVDRTELRPGPIMEIEPVEFDFGDVCQDQQMSYGFTLSNTGTETLDILHISTSCGCAAAVTPDRKVQPGESTTLMVSMKTLKYKGVIERSVSIASNDKRRVQTVKVKAFVQVPE